ncbi:tetratricopeptide repeat protein [Flavobacterium nackdongense]|uniref:Tetratricopeptide repeat protein n=1 Tax=Flavobacterium nackdongense TaxID=2547394 RepID=A0A4P6YBF9_9FLAO|nr:tetratricopeptide repeat protein [Flavobacterium nackdongense]QBN17995.1 tetratricopeptide repeat protein [Flavobacterium nackdongense]
MRTIQKLSILLLSALVLLSCNQKSNTITSQKEYNKYLEIKDNKSKAFVEDEIVFWQKKFDAAPNQISYLSILASNYSKLFENTGNVKYLYKAEDLLLQSNEAYNYSAVGTIRSLARNYISQHRFKEALVLANKAAVIGEGGKETQKLLFDVNMELGNYTQAEQNLKAINNSSDFDYLVRISKWNDHLGDLKTAISLMEKAKNIAILNENKYLQVWTYSNLGDLNGHAGDIQKSYDYYLKALELEPNHSYSLKGIAWIAFSHERNTVEAKRIIDAISKKHNTPDFYLLKAQIAEFENNTMAKNENLNAYFQMLNTINYGEMYNKYNALIYADDKNTAVKALEIAKIEVQHRPTPDSYDLLAWSYYNLGDAEKALEIAEKYVVGKSFEPKLNYHLATIYKANKETVKIAPIKAELLNSIYELGPNLEQKISNL